MKNIIVHIIEKFKKIVLEYCRREMAEERGNSCTKTSKGEVKKINDLCDSSLYVVVLDQRYSLITSSLLKYPNYTGAGYR